MERVELPGSPLYDELRAAEARYWETYADALYDLDTSRLSEVAAGEQLDAHGRRGGSSLERRAMHLEMRVSHSQLHVQCLREPRLSLERSVYYESSTVLNAETKTAHSSGHQLRRIHSERSICVCARAAVGSGWKVIVLVTGSRTRSHGELSGDVTGVGCTAEIGYRNTIELLARRGALALVSCTLGLRTRFVRLSEPQRASGAGLEARSESRQARPSTLGGT